MAAGNAVIGALRVTLGADTAELEAGLKSAANVLGDFAKKFAAGFAAAFTVGSILDGVQSGLKKTIDEMEGLNKASQKLGISVEALSGLKVAADLADISFESLSKGFVKLGKNMVAAVADPASDTAKTFKALGVSVQDANGKFKSSDQVLADVADAFAGIKDGAGKTAAAVAIFGKSGADLIPLLNGGSKAIKDAEQAARDFGVVMSTAGAKSAEGFNDALKLLSLSTKGVFVQALEAVLPTMENLAKSFAEGAKTSKLIQAEIVILTDILKGLITVVITTNAAFTAAGAIWAGAFDAIKQAASGNFTGALDALNKATADVGSIAQKALADVRGLWDGSTKAANDQAVATANASNSLKDFNVQTLVTKNAIDQFIASQQKKLAGQQAEIAQFGQLKGLQEANKVLIEADTIAKTNNLTITAQQKAALDAIAVSTQQYGAVLEGLQLKQANQTPAQNLQMEQDKINKLFQQGAIDAETYANAMQKAAEKAGATWDLAGASIAGSFKDIANSFGKENKAMATAAKIFGAIQATISMFTGAAKALELPFPANLAAMAAVLAKGAALVASIKSQTVPGAATGLSAQVPGGFGGGDSKLFQAMVEPGEHINITPNSQLGGGGLGNPVLTIRGLVDKRYPLDEVKEIMKGIGDAMKFGYKFENA